MLPAAPRERTTILRRRAFGLEYLTIGWNAFEGAVAIAAGLAAGSVALVAFGLDSSIEVLASVVVVWELRGLDRRREATALRVIGACYLVVAAYVSWDAVGALFEGHRPDASPVGFVLLVGTVVAMAALGLAKRGVGRELGSATVTADGRFSLVDGALAAAVLAGLVLTAGLGWWWADATLALVIALFALREGVEAWRGPETETALD